MRFASYLASTVFAVSALASTAALAGPINVGPPGPMVTTETSFETPTLALGAQLQGVITVASINNSAAAVNPVYTTGSGGQFLSAVFGGFNLVGLSQTIPDASNNSSFVLRYSGGFINYYSSPTNPFGNLGAELNGTVANAISRITTGSSLWLSATAETIGACAVSDTGCVGGISLIITGTQQGTGLTNIQASGTSIVYLDFTGGSDLSDFGQNTFLNAYQNQHADGSYQGSANSLQCAQYSLSSDSPFKICGSNDLSTNVIPEPFTLSLFGAGLAGVAAVRRRKAKKAA